MAEPTPTQTPAATPTPTPSQESPLETPVAEVPTAEPVPAVAPVPVPGAEEGDEPEPTAEEQATWTDGEKRLHGALVKERAARKEARATARQLSERLEQLESKLNAPAPAAPVATNPAAAPTPSVPGSLSDCNTFEMVDARVRQAAAMETRAYKLQQTLLRNGVEAVLPQLAQEGIVVENGQLVEAKTKQIIGAATAEDVGDLLSRAYEVSRLTQAEAQPRKQFLAQRSQSWENASKYVPGLNQPNSPEYQQIARVVQNNPQLATHPEGPMIAVKLYLGEQALAGKLPAQMKAAPTTATAPAKPALKSAPGAPRASAAALPPTNRLVELQTKLANGTATMKEVDEYSSMNIGVQAV